MEIKFEKKANEVVYTFDKITSSDEDIKKYHYASPPTY